ncbi:MAG: diguanylate cyclase [Leptolyngbya sp. DLM2.Bin27]|nr:MAG: diguanylate cyclase [Leptolyngbya sp. DLM2.Bin27]
MVPSNLQPTDPCDRNIALLQAQIAQLRAENQRLRQLCSPDLAAAPAAAPDFLASVDPVPAVPQPLSPPEADSAQLPLPAAEAPLCQSATTTRAILAALPDLLLRVGRDGTCYDCVFPQHGAADQFLPIRHSIAEILPSHLLTTCLDHLNRALVTGEMQTWEQKLIKYGRPCYEEVRLVPYGDDQGLLVVRDISDRKAAELALLQSEARFMAISDSSPANIYILVQRVDGSLYFEHMSQSVEAIHEVPVEAVLADATILRDHTHPDDRAGYAAAVQQSRDTLAPFCHEWRIVTPSGQVKWLQGQSQPQRRPNGDTAWYGVVIDISPLKQAEAERQQAVCDLQQSLDQLVATQTALQTSEMQLSGLLNSSLDGIVACRACRDESGRIVDFEGLIGNPAACELLHLTPSTLAGQSMLQVLPSNKTSGIFDHYVQVVETGAPHRQEIYYSCDQIDGWYDVVAVKLGDGIAITFRNITRVKQSELALQAANQQLERQVAQLNQHNAEMRLLGEMSDFLQACPTVKDAYGALAELIKPLFPDCGGGVVVAQRPAVEAPADPGELARVAHWGATVGSPGFHSQDCWAIRHRRSHWGAPGQLDRCCGDLAQGSDTLTTLCVPIVAQGEILGLIHLTSPTPEGLDLSRQQLAQTVVKQLGLALANLHLRETLRHQSIRDPLTGLFNRRYLEEALQKALIAAQRHKHAIGIIMLDLDHFKQFNDTHGHDAGDRALQAVAQLLRASVRGSDIVCRYGGEEITLILPGLALAETQARAEVLRQAIAALTWFDQAVPLTASLGVACFPQHGTSSSDLLKAADTALYQAKQAGRNCVVAAE